KPVAPFTTFRSAYERNTGKEPFLLPKSWLDAKSKVLLDTPLDFCTTNDIIGGNSGSPVLNQQGEIAGLMFDAHIHSLVGGYGCGAGRTGGVHCGGGASAKALARRGGAARTWRKTKRRKRRGSSGSLCRPGGGPSGGSPPPPPQNRWFAQASSPGKPISVRSV